MESDFLHGFLGLQKDWQGLRPEVDRAWDLWPKAQVKLEGLRGAFASECEGAEKRVAFGYGLGGRLLLELARQGIRWKALVLVSVHPGLESSAEREARISNDEAWAQRFEQDPWDGVVRSWDGQMVFRDTTVVERRELDFDRAALGASLRHWSLGRMQSWRPESTPTLWIYGARDPKALSHVAKLESLGAEVAVVSNAGHRVGWDAWKTSKPGQNSENLKIFALKRLKMA